MISVDKSYSSSILFKQAFDPREDIILSFLYTDFETEDLGLVKADDGSFLLLQDNSDFRLNIGTGVVDGLSVFLINDLPGATLTGGGSGLNNPGLNLITDTNTTDLSAVSGIVLIAAIDKSGYFGLSASGSNGSIKQYTSGNTTLTPNSVVVRTANRGNSLSALPTTFDYKGSAPLSSLDTYTVDEKFKVFSIGFKRHLQDISLYNRTSTLIDPVSTINTDIPLNYLPSSVRLGISYSGHRPMEIKNITVNGKHIG